ncbi:coiled-coil domain-containing protein 150 isoform X1 [Scomber scombrus]|uniref:Coiled-coil domain-containing protein 150 isoform X1 n=1 Tax=Scomber scombrus TaxID=13677 RepID=A0AAV1P1M7_SCOSC
MSGSAMPFLSVEATAPDSLSLLHQRLLLAEEQAEALIQDISSLGVSGDHIIGSSETTVASQRPVSLLKIRQVLGDEGTPWQQSDSLVRRMSRMESLLHTLKLTVFHLETEKEMNPSHTARLEQQLAALQQESEEEQQASCRMVLKLRDQLHQAYQERDEACTKVQHMGGTLETATAAKMDVALAAEELKILKLEMSEKLKEMKEQMRQESACSREAMKSHCELLQRVKEMERVMEMERRQALLLQSDCQTLNVEVQTGRQRLEEEREISRQLKEQREMKDSLVFELKTELKVERSRTVKQLQEQNLLLEAARHSIQTELQVVLTDKVNLQMELEKLKGEHDLLRQSSLIAQETALTQKELLERNFERQQGELCAARKEEEAIRKHLEGFKAELCLIVTKLEGERSSLETQLSEAKLEVGSLMSALTSQRDENRRLMGKVIDELEVLQSVCDPAGKAVSQTLENILASHNRLQTQQQELGGQEQELDTLKKDRLQVQRDIRKHQTEVEKLQQLLTSSHSKNNGAFESLQKSLDTAAVDNKRLAKSLELAVSTNSSLHSRLEQARDQYQGTITLRDEELREARSKIRHLSEELNALKQQMREDCKSSVRALQREISELKVTVKDSSSRSGDLSEANRELRRRASELERLVSKQKACIKEQKSQLRQQQKNGHLQDHCERRLKESSRDQHEKEPADRKLQDVKVDSKQVLNKREAEWERWTSTIQRWEDKRELAHVAGKPSL